MVKFLKVSRKKLAELMKSQNLEEKIVCCIENLKLKGKKSTQNGRNKKEKTQNPINNLTCDDDTLSQTSPSLKHSENTLGDQDQVDFFKYWNN